jgi:hypothetical protein
MVKERVYYRNIQYILSISSILLAYLHQLVIHDR